MVYIYPPTHFLPDTYTIKRKKGQDTKVESFLLQPERPGVSRDTKSTISVEEGRVDVSRSNGGHGWFSAAQGTLLEARVFVTWLTK